MRQRAVFHHQYAVALVIDFGDFVGNDEYRQPLRGEFAHDGENARFGADIHADRGRVQNQHARMGRQPFADGDALLVAAGERAHRQGGVVVFDVQPLQPAGRGVFQRFRREARQQAADAVQHRHRGVVADGLRLDEAEVEAVFGNVGDTCGNGVAVAAEAHRLAVQEQGAAVGTVHAEQRQRQFGAPCAQKTGDADDFPGMQGEVDVLKLALARQVARSEHGFVKRRRRTHRFFQLQSGHQTRQGFRLRRFRVQHFNDAAIADDRNAVGDIQHFGEAVRHEHHGNAVRLHFLHRLQQVIDLAAGE